MGLKQGVYIAQKKDKSIYYRSSITYRGKHISLGSFSTEEDAHMCYIEAQNLVVSSYIIEDYRNTKNHTKYKHYLSFEKWVSLINFRDNGIYFKNPIYIYPKYFVYYYDLNNAYKFDVDDLFFYSKHKLMKRQGHLFVSYYGMQLNILSRYGIRNYSVIDKDFIFVNNDCYDFRYKNIKVINRFYGVSSITRNGQIIYLAKIHINGNYIIGRYKNEYDAAIAYNKAAEMLLHANVLKSIQKNYIENLSSIEYASRYSLVKISKKIRDLCK